MKNAGKRRLMIAYVESRHLRPLEVGEGVTVADEEDEESLCRAAKFNVQVRTEKCIILRFRIVLNDLACHATSNRLFRSGYPSNK